MELDMHTKDSRQKKLLESLYQSAFPLASLKSLDTAVKIFGKGSTKLSIIGQKIHFTVIDDIFDYLYKAEIEGIKYTNMSKEEVHNLYQLHAEYSEPTKETLQDVDYAELEKKIAADLSGIDLEEYKRDPEAYLAWLHTVMTGGPQFDMGYNVPDIFEIKVKEAYPMNDIIFGDYPSFPTPPQPW